jgi:HK97 gp10 family phage protein
MIRLDTADLDATFRETFERLQESVGESTLSGAMVFRDEAKRNAQAHIQTGTIYRNIIVKRLEEESESNVRQVYLVTVRRGDYGGGDAYYGPFVEKGHKFVPRNKKISKRTGRKIGWEAHRRAAELEYGNSRAPAYPFMRPAYSSKRQEAVDVMTETLREQIRRNLGGG